MKQPVWVTRDKRRLYPTQMTSSHIHNTIAMIKSGRMAAAGRIKCSGFTNDEWVRILQTELVRRARLGVL